MPKSYTLHDLPQEDRPRERLRKVGVDNLSLQELLALIIEKGGRNQNALQIAQNLLSHFGNLTNLKNASLDELKQLSGVGEATACKLKAALKIGEKALNNHKQRGEKIENAEDVFHLLKDEIGNKKKEHFLLLSLDTRNRLISIDSISVGILNTSLAHPREVFYSAISRSAASIILVHNHPSGDPTPSKDDLEITDRLTKAGKIIDIQIIDHIIICANNYFSLKDQI
ncbi:DNA repair protein RadC [Patescibacteria group bacterium]|nr:DNA repair protein RadC [Patescibacteria group bacterium]MBU1868270.1 DNA repair protein RadC [Patescibacteria group bacterium]